MLVDRVNSQGLGMPGRPEGDGLAINLHRPVVWSVDAGQDLHESRLAGPVLPE